MLYSAIFTVAAILMGSQPSFAAAADALSPCRVSYNGNGFIGQFLLSQQGRVVSFQTMKMIKNNNSASLWEDDVAAGRFESFVQSLGGWNATFPVTKFWFSEKKFIVNYWSFQGGDWVDRSHEFTFESTAECRKLFSRMPQEFALTAGKSGCSVFENCIDQALQSRDNGLKLDSNQIMHLKKIADALVQMGISGEVIQSEPKKKN